MSLNFAALFNRVTSSRVRETLYSPRSDNSLNLVTMGPDRSTAIQTGKDSHSKRNASEMIVAPGKFDGARLDEITCVRDAHSFCLHISSYDCDNDQPRHRFLMPETNILSASIKEMPVPAVHSENAGIGVVTLIFRQSICDSRVG